MESILRSLVTLTLLSAGKRPFHFCFDHSVGDLGAHRFAPIDVLHAANGGAVLSAEPRVAASQDSSGIVSSDALRESIEATPRFAKGSCTAPNRVESRRLPARFRFLDYTVGKT